MAFEFMANFVGKHTLPLCLALMLSAPSEAAERLFYRYLNEEGNTVINHALPPEFTQKGYEVVTASGHVVKVVEPVPDDKELDRKAQQRLEEEHLARWDERLLRRYSTVLDIKAAKKRKLAELQGNVAILTGNLRNLRTQLADLQAQAADIERAGRVVPKAILDNLQILSDEIEATQQQIDLRDNEYNQVADRFDDDVERFKVIRPGTPE